MGEATHNIQGFIQDSLLGGGGGGHIFHRVYETMANSEKSLRNGRERFGTILKIFFLLMWSMKPQLCFDIQHGTTLQQ